MKYFYTAILVLQVFAVVSAAPEPVVCEGTYSGHLQGVASDGEEHIYWSFTKSVVKTDLNGRILVTRGVDNHSGDLCFHEGRIYVAVNLGEFNKEPGKADSWVYVYDSENLKLLDRHAVPQVVHGAGGMDFADGFFYVIGGLPEGYAENYVYRYDPQFNFMERHVLASGYTLMGIQTACFSKGTWWFGCYGSPRECIKTDSEFNVIKRFQYDCSLGITQFRGGFLVAEGFDRYRGRVKFVEALPEGP